VKLIYTRQNLLSLVVRSNSQTNRLVDTSYLYDNAGNLLTEQDSTLTPLTDPVPTADPRYTVRVLSSASYVYDTLGRVTQEQDSGYELDAGRYVVQASRPFRYDNTSQLTNDNGKTQQYDADGNPQGQRQGVAFTLNANTDQVRSFIDNFSYDGEGNRIERSGPFVKTVYAFDAENRLTEVLTTFVRPPGSPSAPYSRVAYTMDPFGNLAERQSWQQNRGTTTARFAYDGAAVHADLRDDTVQRTYLLGDSPDQRFAYLGAGGNDLGWYLTDRLGTVRAIVNSTGLFTAQYQYKGAFKTEMQIIRPTAVTVGQAFDEERFGWAGREYDPVTFLQYNRARWYDPLTARWLTEDPLGLAGGDTNLYRFVGNNPANQTDPSGLFVPGESILLAAAGAVVGAGGYVIGNGIYSAITGEDHFSWGGLAGAAAGGAVAGLVAGAVAGDAVGIAGVITVGALSGAAGGATSGFVSSFLDQGLQKGFTHIDPQEVGLHTIIGAGTGALGGALGGAISVGTAGLTGVPLTAPCNATLGQAVRYSAVRAAEGALGGGLADASVQGLEIAASEGRQDFDWSRLASSAAVGSASSVAGFWASRACFGAGTPLLTPTGHKAIDQFRVGDLVLSRSEFEPGGRLEAKVVEEVFARTGRIMNLHVVGQVIRTTPEHPFYVQGKGWLPGGQLVVGDLLLGHDGRWVAVEDLLDTGEYATVYNLRVADFHTYFVGCNEWGFSVWAHNQYRGNTVDQQGNPVDPMANPENLAVRDAVLARLIELGVGESQAAHLADLGARAGVNGRVLELAVDEGVPLAGSPRGLGGNGQLNVPELIANPQTRRQVLDLLGWRMMYDELLPIVDPAGRVARNQANVENYFSQTPECQRILQVGAGTEHYPGVMPEDISPYGGLTRLLAQPGEDLSLFMNGRKFDRALAINPHDPGMQYLAPEPLLRLVGPVLEEGGTFTVAGQERNNILRLIARMDDAELGPLGFRRETPLVGSGRSDAEAAILGMRGCGPPHEWWTPS
jgi:RHS repeat-associated protein